MMSSEIRAKVRSWVTPITVFVFSLLAASGFLMEFDHRVMRGVHEALGYLFCSIAVLHIALNWRPLLSHLKTAKALAAVVIVAALASLLWAGAINEERKQGPLQSSGSHAEHPDRD